MSNFNQSFFDEMNKEKGENLEEKIDDDIIS